MNDMSSTIVAKSDQINAADLVGSPRTIVIREVRIKADEDQPVSVLFEGDAKAFRPCKGVRRLMVQVWGPDANNYIGKSMTLFHDPSVTWAGKPEGGIRVSHMSGLSSEITVAMRTSRNATKPYRILPLAGAKPGASEDAKARKWADQYLAKIAAAPDLAALNDYANSRAVGLATIADMSPDLHRQCIEALDARRQALSGGALELDEDDGAPAHAALVERLKDALAEALDGEDIDAAASEFAKHRESLPDEVIEEIDALFAAKRRDLAAKVEG